MKWLIVAIGLAVAFLGGWQMAKNHFEDNHEKVTDTLIVVRTDTICIEKPTEIVRYVQRFDTIRLNDTIVKLILSDSTALLPIECAIYQDSTEKAKYTAFLSGFRPILDSIQIETFATDRIITIEKPQKRLGIGVQAGVGVAKGGFSPYIGLGVQYRLW